MYIKLTGGIAIILEKQNKIVYGLCLNQRKQAKGIHEHQ